MESVCVVAIVRPEVREAIEKAVREIDTHGVTVSKVKGFGKHLNPYAEHWETGHLKFEIFTRVEDTDALVQAIMKVAHVGTQGDGVVAVMPVTHFFSIHAMTEVLP